MLFVKCHKHTATHTQATHTLAHIHMQHMPHVITKNTLCIFLHVCVAWAACFGLVRSDLCGIYRLCWHSQVIFRLIAEHNGKTKRSSSKKIHSKSYVR